MSGLAVLVAAGAYLQWRIGTLDRVDALSLPIFAAEILAMAQLVATVCLLFARGTRSTTPLPGPPAGTLDVLITVCGEPQAMVEATLRAALAIEYPHRTYLLNDGLIADKDHWSEIDALALRYGVPCFTRSTGRRCKAANLNHALPHLDGDFVVTIDADNRAVSGLGHEVLGHFADPLVAFVATPQHYGIDGSDVFNAREPTFHRVLQQAKQGANAAFSCGNGATYRRTALDAIGGFSEWNIVEDLHTSYELHADGWRGVYHDAPVTIGEAPATAAAVAKQRLGWATDSVRILLWDSPLRKAGLTIRQRLHYFLTTVYYVFAATQVVLMAAPLLALALGMRVLPDGLAAYAIHAGPYLLCIAVYLSVCAGPMQGLRMLRQQLFLGPIFVQAVVRASSRLEFDQKVTEKQRQRAFSPLLLPHLLLMGGLGVALILFANRDRGPATLWALFMLAMLWGPMTAVTKDLKLVRRLRRGAGVPLAAAAVVLLGLTGAATGQEPMSALVPSSVGVYLGIFDPALETVDGLHADRGIPGSDPQIIHRYQQWLPDGDRFPGTWADAVADRGAVPLVTWEPWAKPHGGLHDPVQPNVALRRIIAGRFDGLIERWADGAAAYGRPVLLRVMHEMNGTWYPWSVRTNGNTPAQFIAAWRHIHRIFDRAGAHNVRWVWTVNAVSGLPRAASRLDEFYPGRAWVDWVSTTGFNWGRQHEHVRRTPRQVFARTLGLLQQFHKPIMVSEIATVTNGGDPRAWTRDALRYLVRAPRVRAVVWSNADWRGTRSGDIYPFRMGPRMQRTFVRATHGAGWRPPLLTTNATSP